MRSIHRISGALLALLIPVGATFGQSVEWVWTGAVTTSSARVNARISQNSSDVRLAVGPDSDLVAPTLSGPWTADLGTNNRVVSIPLGGLQSDTRYYYELVIDGSADTAVTGSFRTFPSGAASFTFALASCALTNSSHAVFTTIRNLEPLFFLHLGDMHYRDISTNDPALIRSAYQQVLTSASQSRLYRRVPVAYVWDDHDYGGNNSDGGAASKPAARAVYQESVPHYPLGAGSGNVPIYQAFTVGRARIILTDNRSERSPSGAVDNASKSMLGATQKAWLKQELLAADGVFPLIIWSTGVPWIATAATPGDLWGGYSTERAEISAFIEDNDIDGLVLVAGDAHMLAIDDGTNSNYSTSAGPGPPVFQAGALDRTGGVKGGPYSEGTYPGGGQFGLFTVTDDGGDSIGISWRGLNASMTELVSLSFSLPAEPVSDVAGPDPADPAGPEGPAGLAGLPSRPELLGNYPNPFNPSTTIVFQIPGASGGRDASTISLKIFDLLGREIAAPVVSSHYPPGTHSVAWDGTDRGGAVVPAGVYICRLTTSDGLSASGRLLFLR